MVIRGSPVCGKGPYQTAARSAKALDEQAAAAVDAKAAACAASAEPPKGLSALA